MNFVHADLAPNPNFDKVIDTISVGQVPAASAFNPTANYMYFTASGTNQVIVMDTNPLVTVANHGGFDSSPNGGLMCPDGVCSSQSSFVPPSPQQAVQTPVTSPSQAPNYNTQTNTRNNVTPQEVQNWVKSLGEKIVSTVHSSQGSLAQQSQSAPEAVQQNISPISNFFGWLHMIGKR